MSCDVVSCRVVSCRVMSCHVTSCHVTSCYVMSCSVVPCRFMSQHIMSYLMSCTMGESETKQEHATIFLLETFDKLETPESGPNFLLSDAWFRSKTYMFALHAKRIMRMLYDSQLMYCKDSQRDMQNGGRRCNSSSIAKVRQTCRR